MISKDRQTDRQTDKLTGFPSIDKPWLKFYSQEILDAAIPDCSMYEYLVNNTNNIKDNYCLNFFGNRITYSELYSRINDTAAALTKLGLKKGDVISICILTVPENYYLMYAANMLGCVCNYIAVNSNVEDIRKKIVATDSKVVFTINLVRDNVLKAVENLKGMKVISVPLYNSMPLFTKLIVKQKMKSSPCVNVIEWNKFIKEGKNTPFSRAKVDGNTPAIIEYTSGTTGESKGALHPNKTSNMIAHYYANMGDEMIFNPGERFLNILPPFVAYGIFVGVHMPVCLGVEVFLCPSPDPIAVDKDFKKCKPHHFTGSPIHISAIMADEELQKMDLSFLKTTACGGDIMSDSWIEQVNSFLANRNSPSRIIVGYGMTESAGTFCTGTQKTSGMMPFPKNNLKILDVDTNEEKKFNETGEVYLSGPTLMDGYFKNDEMTNEVIKVDKDGTRWLKTGDLGYVTEEGFLVINGRLKRIYWTMGLNGEATRVYPMKIEQVIDELDSVVQSAVVGVKDDVKGYLSYAMLVVSDMNKKDEIISEVRTVCEKKLDKVSLPVEYRVVDKLPRTSAGKVDYKQIEECFNA